MAKFQDSQYLNCEPAAVIRMACEIFEEDNWTIQKITDNSISAKEGLLGFLTSGPVSIDLGVSTPHPDEAHRGSARIDVSLSCLGLGPINKSRLKRINDKIAGRLVFRVAGLSSAPNKDSEDNWVPESGQETKQNQFCTSCGEQLSGEAKFCGSCGTKV